MIIKNLIIYVLPSRSERTQDTRYTFNLSNLRDPIGQAGLRTQCQNGRDPRVMEWIKSDPKVEATVEAIALLARIHLSDPSSENNLSITLHDVHGRWISPAVAALAAERLKAYSEINTVVHYA